jgi:hypothetical protein
MQVMDWTPITTSTLTCPECAGASEKQMATDSCEVVYLCRHCATMLRPKPGDCCVYCSFGTVPCPPIQESRAR